MSYDISLIDPSTGKPLQLVEPLMVTCGIEITDANIGITWNYAPHFYRVLGKQGLRTIYGLTGAESIKLLEQAIEQLADNTGWTPYFTPTEGNAKRALLDLANLARLCPDGVWDGD